MRFPDQTTISRSTGPDEYANPASDPDVAEDTELLGFLVTPELLLLPAEAVIAPRDRVRCRGRLYVAREVTEVRSPAKTVIWTVRVEEIPE